MSNIQSKLKEAWVKIKSGLIQVLGANLVNKIVAVLSNMVITRVLSTSDYGTWSYVLNQYTYLSIVSALGLLYGALQFGTEHKGKEKAFTYFRYCLKYGLYINLALVGIGILRSFLFKPALPNAGLYLVAYIPVLMLEYVMNFFTTVLRCENRIKEYAKALNINTVLVTIGTCTGALVGITGVIIGKYVAYGISVIILKRMLNNEIRLIKTTHGSLIVEELKELWHFSIMSCVSAAMNSLLFLIDVSMVTSLIRDAEQTAVYKVATFAPNALSFIPTSVAVYLLPNLVQNNKNKEWLRNNVKKYYIYMGSVNFAIATGIVLFAPLVVSILAGSKYLAAVPYLKILVIGYAISATFRIMSSNILFGLKKVNINMLINGVACGADVILNYTLIIKSGAMGAAYATVISETIASVVAFSYVMWVVFKKQESIDEQSF